MVPLYHKSYWIPCNINDALGQLDISMTRSHFCAHHMMIMLLTFPLQRCKKSEGGPPCNSMPLRCGLGLLYLSSILASAAS